MDSDATKRFETSAAGAMVGCALGDAIGELAFSHPDRQGLHAAAERASPLVYTDDTAMAVALAEALIARREVDLQAIGENFAAHYEREPWRGYGPGPPQIFRIARESGRDFAEIARELHGGRGSFGNGGAMRAAPLGIAFGSGEQAYQAASSATSVTHAHPVGRDGAAVQAVAVGLAVEHHITGRTLDPIAAARTLTGISRTPEIRDKMEIVVEALESGATPQRVADLVGRGIAVHESMPFAVYAFLRFPEEFPACLECAALNGGDRDTLGAMACSIAGAYLGYARLPEAWHDKVENLALLRRLALDLTKSFPLPA